MHESRGAPPRGHPARAVTTPRCRPPRRPRESRRGPRSARHVPDRPKQREAPTLAIEAVLPGGESDGAVSVTALPHREADQLQAGERSVGEVQLRVRELSRGIARVVQDDLDSECRGGRCCCRHLVLQWNRDVWFLRDVRNPPDADPERTRPDAPARQRTVAGGVTGALPGASRAGALALVLGRRGIRTARGDSRPLRICQVDQKPRRITGYVFAATSGGAVGAATFLPDASKSASGCDEPRRRPRDTARP
jgi:hypothetical protein